MSYQVLANKYRPSCFSEVVGQESSLKVLEYALNQDRLHHAYIFSGTRGVGKTTLARIFAKAVNCEKGPTSKPCEKCDHCQAINQNRYTDFYEIDAASRTGVDDMRNLLEGTQYAPQTARYKVYLIDEVHMLSKSSFNALLKTLEEPPVYIKFLFATTKPHKMPATVLSRCLQIHLQNIPTDTIAIHLKLIVKKEKIKAEAEAIKIIARSASGSMRDGMSLLDQAIAQGGGKIDVKSVYAMLGVVGADYIEQILENLITSDGKQLFITAERIHQDNPNYSNIIELLLGMLSEIALWQQLGKLDNTNLNTKILASFAAKITPEQVQLYYQIALLAQRDLNISLDAKRGFEMALLRLLAFTPKTKDLQQTTDESKSAGVATKQEEAAMLSIEKQQEAGQWRNIDHQEWKEIALGLNTQGVLYQLVTNSVLISAQDGVLKLSLAQSEESLLKDSYLQELEKMLLPELGQIRIEFKLAEQQEDSIAKDIDKQRALTRQQIVKDPDISHLIQDFNADVRILEETE